MKTRANSIVIGLNYVDDNHKEWRAARAEQMPMKKIAYAEDYVKCIDFFLNHDYITGTSLRLDGDGLYITPIHLSVLQKIGMEGDMVANCRK